jgi:hypothetical protein
MKARLAATRLKARIFQTLILFSSLFAIRFFISIPSSVSASGKTSMEG